MIPASSPGRPWCHRGYPSQRSPATQLPPGRPSPIPPRNWTGSSGCSAPPGQRRIAIGHGRHTASAGAADALAAAWTADAGQVLAVVDWPGRPPPWI